MGELSAADAIALGASGPVARASGVAHDLRKAEPYCVYDRFEFDIPVGERGDVYDRYRVRIAEMRESHRIITQALEHLPEGDYKIQDWRYTLPPREAIKRSMEELIYHFKFVTEGIRPPAGEVYRPIEGPKGEIGFYLVSDGSPRPLRCRVRPPSFINLQALPKICEGRLVADLVAILGSIDIVLGRWIDERGAPRPGGDVRRRASRDPLSLSDRRSAILPVLQLLSESMAGSPTIPCARWRIVGCRSVDVYGSITFYSIFHRQPPGNTCWKSAAPSPARCWVAGSSPGIWKSGLEFAVARQPRMVCFPSAR